MVLILFCPPDQSISAFLRVYGEWVGETPGQHTPALATNRTHAELRAKRIRHNSMELLRAMKRLILPFLVLSIFVMTQACTTISQANAGNAVISSVSPSQVVAGSSTGFTLNVYGSGFVGNAVVLWNGSARATRVISKTQLQASISSTDIQQAGSAAVTVDDQRGSSAPSNSVFVTIQPAASGLSISPTTAVVTAGNSQQFSATGATNASVSWMVNGTLGGNSTVGTISGSGLYKAPNVSSNSSVKVTAVDGAIQANASVTIVPAATSVSVSLSPTSANVQVGRSQQFTATVSGTTNTAVNWLAGGIPGGNSSVGTISSTGLYTAPSSVPTSLVTVTAQSAANSTSSANATVTILPAPTPVSVSISPTSANVQVGRSQQFTATISGTTNTAVNWLVGGIAGGNSSVGTISSTGLYAAPSSVPANPVTVTAQSAFASTSSANATVTITPASAQLTANPSSLNFGNVNVGSNSSMSVILTNSGNSIVTISNVGTSGPGFNVSGASGIILSPAQSTTLTATFTPGGTGTVSGSITISSNAANSSLTINLSGAGVQSQITSITVTPANQTVPSGTQVQFKAVDNFGNDITSSVAWSSSDPSIVSITAGGLATGIVSGTATIMASK
jgi:hypothetical protein